MAVMKKKSKMDDPWAKPVKKITTVPKKVVEAKVTRNPNAPKPTQTKSSGVKIIPGGSKPKTMTKTEKEKQRLTPPRRVGGRKGGAIGGFGGGGARMGQVK